MYCIQKQIVQATRKEKTIKYKVVPPTASGIGKEASVAKLKEPLPKEKTGANESKLKVQKRKVTL